MNKMYYKVLKLIENYAGDNLQRNNIVKMISENEFKNNEYSEFCVKSRYCHDDYKLFRSIIKILPLKVLLEISLFDTETFFFDYEYDEIFKRFENFNAEQLGMLLYVDNEEIRARVVEKVDVKQVVRLSLIEEDEIVIEAIIDYFEKVATLDLDTYNCILLNAKADEIKEYALENCSIEAIIKFAISENVIKCSDSVKSVLKNIIENENLTSKQIKELLKSNEPEVIYAIYDKIGLEEFNHLLDSKNNIIRMFSVEYASLENVLKLALVEENNYVIYKIIERLDKEEVFIEQMDCLSKAISRKIRSYSVHFVSTEALIEMALIEENEFVLAEIVKRLNTTLILSEVQYGNLLNAISKDIREYALEKASINEIINHAIKEEDEEFAKEYISVFKKLDNLSESDYSFLINAKSIEIRKYVLRNANFNDILKLAIQEEDEELCESILKRIKTETMKNFDKSIVNKLLYAKSHIIKKYAVSLVDIETLMNFVNNEENIDADILKLAMNRLKKHQIVEFLLLDNED